MGKSDQSDAGAYSAGRTLPPIPMTLTRGWILLIAGLALAGGLAAQDAAGEAQTYPLKSIRFEGLHTYAPEQVLQAANLKVGMEVNRATFLEAQRRLVATGAFESVAFQYGPSEDRSGYDAVFNIAEIAQTYTYQFANIGVDEAALRAWLHEQEPLFGDVIPGTDEMIARFSSDIGRFLANQGQGETIKGEVTMDRPGEFYLLFYPAGAIPIIAEVDFTGYAVVSRLELRQAIQGVAVGSRYTESSFRQILDAAIRPIYEARGRLEVAFPNLSVERTTGGVKGVKVTVEVDEGPSYTLGQIAVEGTASMNRELLDAAHLTTGDLADFSEVDKAVDRIEQAMHTNGYMEASTTVNRKMDEQNLTVDVTLQVEPGPLYTFGKLSVEGLDINGEFEVRRIWGLQTGDTFRADYPDYFLKQVQELGVFDNLNATRSHTDLDETAHVANVTLLFNPSSDSVLPGTFVKQLQ